MGCDTLIGGWYPIKDVTDPDVLEMAKFAISEHNMESEANLEYDRVIEGKKQLVAGYNYDLIIAMKNSGEKKYQAIVYHCPWENLRILTSFEQL